MMKYYRLVLWSFVIGILCFTPGNEVREIKISIPHFDKLIHFIMFLGLGLYIQGVQICSHYIKFRLVVSGIFYAISIEVIQHYFISQRSGDIVDFIADSIGLFVGYFTYQFFPSYIKKLLS